MSQFDFGTIVATSKTGSALASDLNSWRTALNSTHKGPTAPTYLIAGMQWIDDTAAALLLRKIYDGTDWITAEAIDTTNNVVRPLNVSEKQNFPVAGGTADALTLTPAISLTAYADMDVASFEAASNNTTAATLNVSGVGAKAIRKMVAGADVSLVAGEILDGVGYFLRYDTAANAAAGAWILLNPSIITLESSDAGAAAGPSLTLSRNSASPAANDVIGTIEFTGKDSAGNTHTYSAIRAGIDATTNGAEEGSVSFWASNSGSLTRILNLSDGLSCTTTGGLINPSVAEYGFSVSVDTPGETTISCTGTTPLRVKRGETGNLMAWYVGTTNVATISEAGGVVTYGAFCGAHWAQFSDVKRHDVLIGSILETIDEMCEWPDEKDVNTTLVRVRICETPGSVRPYGVFSHWDEDSNDMHVASLGVKSIRIQPGENVEGGDLVEAGDVPGCGRIMRDESMSAIQVRKRHVATITGAIPTTEYPDGSKLFPCSLHCG